MLAFPIALRYPTDTSAPVTGAIIQPDGRIFRMAGQPWRYCGVSAFRLLDAYAKGEDIASFCDAYARFNTVRVFCYTPEADWGDQAWDMPPPVIVVDFLRQCERLSKYVELVLLTDDDPARIDPAIALVRVLISVAPRNTLIEIGNEVLTHKRINAEALKPICDEAAAVGIPYSSGIYEDERLIFGTYITHHSARTSDWPRRAHDAMEFYDGAGPHQPHAPLHLPCVLDEPIRPDQAPGNLGQKVKDYRAYGGAAAIMGAGATIHSESGKFARLPSTDEFLCAQALADGLEAFPGDAPLGPYRRLVEPGNEPGGPTQDARTYIVGNCMVRCQQQGTTAPEPGWTSLDTSGVLWRR